MNFNLKYNARPWLARSSLAGALFVVVLLIAIDQFTKWASWTHLDLFERADVLVFLAFQHVHNEGIAFSMFEGLGRWALVAITCTVLAAIIWLWTQLPRDRAIGHMAFALFAAGALGNIIDRTAWGYVEDMFAFHVGTWSFAIFNVADVYLSLGAVLLILDELRTWWVERKQGDRAQG